MEPTAVTAPTTLPFSTTDADSSLDDLLALSAARTQVLHAAARVFAAPEQMHNQKALGVWRWSSGVTFPKMEEIMIYEGGCMTFPISAIPGACMSIWVQMGEIRVGAMIPLRFVQTGSPTRDKIMNAFDGSPCQRVTDGQRAMFDWIFREDFAAYGNMLQAFSGSSPHKAALIDRLAGILTHLYMAINNLLLDVDRGATGMFQSGQKTTTKTVSITMKGDLDFMRDWLRGTAHIKSERPVDATDRSGPFIFVVDLPLNVDIPLGHRRDDDGRELYVIDCTPQ